MRQNNLAKFTKKYINSSLLKKITTKYFKGKKMKVESKNKGFLRFLRESFKFSETKTKIWNHPAVNQGFNK
jgi:hypothetical protein